MLVKFDTSVCRICLKSKGVYSLFENESIVKNFTFVTLLEASESDNLPSALCEKCYLSLRISAYLKKQAIATNIELISYLKKINETFLALPSKTKVANDDSISDINVNELAEFCPEENDTKIAYKLTAAKEKNEKHSDTVVKESNELINVDEIKVNFVELRDDDEDYDDLEELMDETNAIECDEIPTDIDKLIKFNKRTSSTSNANTSYFKFQKDYENKINIMKKENDSNDDQNIDNVLEMENDLEINFENEDSTDAYNKKENDKINNKNSGRKYKKRRYIPDVIKVSSALKDDEEVSQKNRKRKSLSGIINDIFHCGECDNTFTTKLNLDRHMEIHLNRRKAFSCDICGKLFTQLNSVREHMHTHTGEKPYKCDICNKAFSRRQIYKRHLQTHTKIKKFECKQCDQKFTVKRTLMLHRSRIHGDGETIEHKCQICSKSYRSKYTLSDHLQNVHSISV